MPFVDALDNDLWQQWGIQSPEHWLAWQTGLSPRAKQLVDTARRARELPVTFAAFADGELSVDQVVAVARFTPSHNDAEVCQLARAASVSQLRNALSRYVHNAGTKPDPEPEPVGPLGDPRDYVSSGFDDDGRFAMHVGAPAHHGAVIDQALREARDALFHAGQVDVTWLDALIEVCNRSLDTVCNASRRDRYRIYLHLDTDHDAGPAHAWLNGGPQLPARRCAICCVATVWCDPLWHTGGIPVNVGRAQYIVPAHTRRCILDRDRCCRHPSCNNTTHLEIHHIIEWLRGGMTDMNNLVALCGKHHHAYHRGEFTMAGNANIPGALRFYNATANQSPTEPRQTHPPAHHPHPTSPTPTPPANTSTPSGSTSPPTDRAAPRCGTRLRLEEEHHGVGHHAVVGHRLGKGRAGHRSHQGVHVLDVGDQPDVVRILRVDERADVAHSHGPHHLCTLRRGEPVILVLHEVVGHYRRHGASLASGPCGNRPSRRGDPRHLSRVMPRTRPLATTEPGLDGPIRNRALSGSVVTDGVITEGEERRAQQIGQVSLLSLRQRGEDLALGRQVGDDDLVDEVEALLRETDDHLPTVAARRALTSRAPRADRRDSSSLRS